MDESPVEGWYAMDGNEHRRWSQEVSETSRALELEKGVFTWSDPKKIARSLKRSAAASRRRKSEPFRSAMAMLNFYINRAGQKLPPDQREVLETAKEELRELYGRPRRPAPIRPAPTTPASALPR